MDEKLLSAITILLSLGIHYGYNDYISKHDTSLDRRVVYLNFMLMFLGWLGILIPELRARKYIVSLCICIVYIFSVVTLLEDNIILNILLFIAWMIFGYIYSGVKILTPLAISLSVYIISKYTQYSGPVYMMAILAWKQMIKPKKLI